MNARCQSVGTCRCPKGLRRCDTKRLEIDDIGVRHENTGFPSISTVHAPALPDPASVPISSIFQTGVPHTVEGLGQRQVPDRLQRAFIEEQAATSAAIAFRNDECARRPLLERSPNATRRRDRAHMSNEPVPSAARTCAFLRAVRRAQALMKSAGLYNDMSAEHWASTCRAMRSFAGSGALVITFALHPRWRSRRKRGSPRRRTAGRLKKNKPLLEFMDPDQCRRQHHRPPARRSWARACTTCAAADRRRAASLAMDRINDGHSRYRADP